MTRFKLPARGEDWINLRREIWSSRADDIDWTHGAFYYHWPQPGRNIHQAAMAAANLFFDDPWLGRFTQPSLRRMVSEIEGMVLDILDAPADAHCTLTSGGSESIMLAVKAARDWARDHRPQAGKPHILLPRSAHPAFNKAAEFLMLDVVRVPLGGDLRADVAATADAITDDTIMIVGSAPCWPYGVIDPIPALAELALRHDLWCHVDACVGGFLVPFYRKLGHQLPDIGFGVPGVTSISADLHKFGFTPHGISSVSLRDAASLRYQRFDFADWPTGRYVSDTVQGTKAGATAAAAWATMRQLGAEGYTELARRLARATESFVDGLATIDGLSLTARPEAGLLVFTSESLDIFAVSDALSARGFPHLRVNQPDSIHLVMNPVEDARPIDAFLDALRLAVAEVRKNRVKRTSSEAIYT